MQSELKVNNTARLSATPKETLGEIVRVSQFLSRLVCSLAEDLQSKQMSDIIFQVPAISQYPFGAIKAEVEAIVQNLDCVNQLQFLLAGAISNAADRGYLETKHPTAAVKRVLGISESNAKVLLDSWNASYKPEQQPEILPHMVAKVASNSNAPDSDIFNQKLHPVGSDVQFQSGENNGADPSVQFVENSETDRQVQNETSGETDPISSERPVFSQSSDAPQPAMDSLPMVQELSEIQQRHLSHIRKEEHRRRQTQQITNQQRIAGAVENRTITAGIKNILHFEVSKLRKESPVCKQDVVAETLNWIDLQRDEYIKHCEEVGATPRSENLRVTADSIAKYVRTRVKELNSAARPLDRVRARSERYFSIKEEAGENSLVTIHGKLAAEQAANLRAAIEMYSKPKPRSESANNTPDTRTRGQRQADALDHMASLSAQRSSQASAAQMSNSRAPRTDVTKPRGMVIIAAEQQEIIAVQQATAILNKGLSQAEEMYLNGQFSQISATTDATAHLHKRTNLNQSVHPPGSLHPDQKDILATAMEKILKEDLLHEREDSEFGDHEKFDLKNHEDQTAYFTAVRFLLTHTFGTNTGYDLTLDEIQRLGIADNYLIGGIDEDKAQMISLTSTRRSGGPLFRELKVVEQGVCSMPGSTLGVALCDLHHIKAWAAGGSTNFDNLTSVSKQHHVQNDDSKSKPQKGHFERHPQTGIVGWVSPQEDEPTGHIFPNYQPQALRAPARRIDAQRRYSTEKQSDAERMQQPDIDNSEQRRQSTQNRGRGAA